MSRRTSWLSPSLAHSRAQRIGELRYELDLEIDAGARHVRGRQRIALALARRGADRALVLDWRPSGGKQAIERTRASLRANGERIPRASIRIADGHLIIGARQLRIGSNRIELQWEAPIDDAGSALTRYVDPSDGCLYVYTLFVPADASSVFPCFDQPDLKARFSLSLTLPNGWQAITNAPLALDRSNRRTRFLHFAPTEPISTYVFAFAAGPFVALRSPSAPGTLWLRRSQASRARPHGDTILGLNARAVRYFERYFARRFPFAKYDLVAIPDLPYRGMEHAGATFLAEQDLFLPPGCGLIAQWERAQLIFHETAHQWAGDLVTMRAFDDLWLKEGFANFMAYKLAARVLPRALAEVAFHRLKVQAYQTEQSAGTTALHHALPDMALAKSAYGAIVYAKAPAVLRQLEFLLGGNTFRRGIRRWVRHHAYGASDWKGLVSALENASGHSLRRWARAWILAAGAPRLRATVRWAASGQPVLRIEQSAAGPARQRYWPLRMRVAIQDATGRTRSDIVAFDRARTQLRLDPTGAEIRFAALNAGDHAYAIVACDPADTEAAGEAIGRTRSALQRIQLWECLWQSVRDNTFHPARFVALAIAHLAKEPNAMIVVAVLRCVHVAIDRLHGAECEPALAVQLDRLLLEQARSAQSSVRPVWIDGLVAMASTNEALQVLERLALGRRTGAGPSAPALRQRAAMMLLVRGIWPRAMALRTIAGERTHAAALRMQLAAAQPDPQSKQQLFERWLADASLTEAAIVASLDVFSHPTHVAWTLPLLSRALRAVPVLYRRRKIFFVNRWIGAFVGGQCSDRAQRIVQQVLARRDIDEPIRRKLLEAEHELAIAVAIRTRWQQESSAR